MPVIPDGATYKREGFYDHKNVSFVGRPFPLEQADEHFSRLKSWGLNFIRFLVSWEAIEHKGPGEYDTAYLDYIFEIIKKAGDYGIQVFIDPHQDVWSRWTGGDGAPGWTLEAVGMDITRLAATGAAITHQEHGDPLPTMIWPTNNIKLGSATLFTLFFGGNDFAPETKIDGVPVQEYLQNHYINAISQIAIRLKDLMNIVGFDTLNEPDPGYIGFPDIGSLSKQGLLCLGPVPTPFQAMLLGSGHPQSVNVWKFTKEGIEKNTARLLNPFGETLWRKGYECVWKQNGVWTDKNHETQLLRPHHFSELNGKPVDFTNNYLKPFVLRYISAIREILPDAIMFFEGSMPTTEYFNWKPEDPDNVVYAGHWYDVMTLFTKEYLPEKTMDNPGNNDKKNPSEAGEEFIQQLADYKESAHKYMGSIPLHIGEFGLAFDLNNKSAYVTGNFSVHIKALDAYFNAIDDNLLNCTIWNYTADNTNLHGDKWNDEDLSIFSYDQQQDPDDINSGGRALKAIVRPYARKIAGEPLYMRFDLSKRILEVKFRHNKNIKAPTEIFIPNYQYPEGYKVELSDGNYNTDIQAQILTVHHTTNQETHLIKISPLNPDN